MSINRTCAAHRAVYITNGFKTVYLLRHCGTYIGVSELHTHDPISADVLQDFQSLRGLVQQGPPLQYHTPYTSYYPTEDSQKVSDLVTLLATELAPLYQPIDLDM